MNFGGNAIKLCSHKMYTKKMFIHHWFKNIIQTWFIYEHVHGCHVNRICIIWQRTLEIQNDFLNNVDDILVYILVKYFAIIYVCEIISFAV